MAANNIRQCDGLTEAMSYWTFSDVFEEQGVVHTPFYGGFGLVAADHIPKPALNAFAMLHQLGDRRLPLASESALATKTSDGKVVVALWNYAAPYGTGPAYTPPPSTPAPSKSFDVAVSGVPPGAAVTILRLDQDRGNAVRTFDAMGRPSGSLTPEQVKTLRAAGAMAPAETMHLAGGHLKLDIPPQGLVLLTIAAAR